MIEKNINETLVKNEPAARALISSLFNIDDDVSFQNATVYHQFPIYPNFDTDKTISANVIFLSQVHGIFIFQCVEYVENIVLGDPSSRLSEIDRLIYAKILKESPRLQKGRRDLKVDIIPVIYLHKADKVDIESEFDVVKNEKQLKDIIMDSGMKPLSEEDFRDLKATIEGSKGIVRSSERPIKDSKDYVNSKGAILSAIENEIYNFDIEQKRSALFIIDGPQRIRGLAGSGKTVILAMKAAIIHLQFPEANVLYTYYTKSLNDIVKNLITRFYRQFADRDPNWNKINIMHAWGGQVMEGVYYNTCKLNDVDPVNYTTAVKIHAKDPFDYICGELNKKVLKQRYDYTLIDEAQDFPPHFYRVCRQITKNNRVVWAYDDFQNILDVKIQNEKETFGKSPEGEYYVDFSKGSNKLQDIILHKCYRNPRKILVSAFALGLGIYNKNEKKGSQVIQRLENNEHWMSLGFNVESGDSSDGSKMKISRPQDNSSEIKNTLLDEEHIIKVRGFESLNKEVDFIAKAIMDDISKELNPEDITVICMDNRNVKIYFEMIALRLNKHNIKVFNLLNASSMNKCFKVKNHVTLSTIFNAKGNEAGSVYICGTDSVFSRKNDITERNKIFTAMTRSLAWVTITGMGNSVSICIDELKNLVENDYKLIFTQPTQNEVNTIRQEINENQQILNEIERLADKLEKGGFSKEDLQKQLKSKNFKK
jgi:superfamily I DNA and RNA helicase